MYHLPTSSFPCNIYLSQDEYVESIIRSLFYIGDSQDEYKESIIISLFYIGGTLFHFSETNKNIFKKYDAIRHPRIYIRQRTKEKVNFRSDVNIRNFQIMLIILAVIIRFKVINTVCSHLRHDPNRI